jgi:hypothetical protein
VQEQPLALYPCGVTTEEAKRRAPANTLKRRSKHEFTRHPNSSHDTPSTSWDTTTISKMGPIIAEGPANLRVPRQNPPVRLKPLRATRVRDEATQRVASIWCIRGPTEGTWHPQASYLSPEWELSFTPLYVGWHLAVRVFPPGITRERRLKAPGLDLIAGVLAPI